MNIFAGVAVVTGAMLAGDAVGASVPPEPVSTFEQWASDTGIPVTEPACAVGDGTVTCYGFAEDRASVVVGFGTVGADGLTMTGVPVVLPSTSPSTPPGSEPAADLATSFGVGTHLVGVDIAPGVYRTDGGEGCLWQRLSGLTGDLDDILANDRVDGPVVVEILDTDVAFQSDDDCGTWTLMQ
jgi:hypothetical protein